MLGVVENMSIHICSNCGHEEHIFGAGGEQRMAAQYNVSFLGSCRWTSASARKLTAASPRSLRNQTAASPGCTGRSPAALLPGCRCKPRTTATSSPASSFKIPEFRPCVWLMATSSAGSNRVASVLNRSHARQDQRGERGFASGQPVPGVQRPRCPVHRSQWPA